MQRETRRSILFYRVGCSGRYQGRKGMERSVLERSWRGFISCCAELSTAFFVLNTIVLDIYLHPLCYQVRGCQLE